MSLNALGSQFETHVQNIMNSVNGATAGQRERGLKWYPEAHDKVRDLAVAELPQHPMEDLDAPAPGGNLVGSHFVPPKNMQRAAGEVAALSPARPSGMEWSENVPAAHQLRDITPGQVKNLDTAITAHAVQQKAEGVRRKASYGPGGLSVKQAGPRTEAQSGAEDSYNAAQADFKKKSAKARAPFKGTPMAHAGVESMKKAHNIHIGATAPLTSLGEVKERHFAHDLLAPHNAEVVFHGASGTVDEHMRNVMEGPQVNHVWNEDSTGHGGSNAGKPARTAPDPSKPAGYMYGRAALHEAARRMGMRPNAAQPISWIHEKETKPNQAPKKSRGQ